MYTPFLAHLLEHVGVFDQYAKNSEAKDQSYVTGWFRSKELSEIQQKNARLIYKTMTEFDQNNFKDQALFDKLEPLLKKMITETRAAVTRYKGEKSTTWLLLELELFKTRLEQAHQHFKTNELFDKERNHSPLIVFRTVLTTYLTDNEVYKKALEIGYYSILGWLWNITFSPTLNSQKVSLVSEYLSKFRLGKNLDLSRDAMRAQFSDVLKQESIILDKKKIEGTIPVQLGILSSGIPVNLVYKPKTLSEGLEAGMKLLELSRFTESPVIRLASLVREGSPPPLPVASSSNNNNNNLDGDELDEVKYYSDDEDDAEISTTHSITAKSV